MTFDYAPDWIARAIAATEYTSGSPLSPPLPCAPSHPTIPELAALVAELFAEGTLSWEQLCALSTQPELNRLLAQTIDEAPATRRASR